jgi:hypothetical protein
LGILEDPLKHPLYNIHPILHAWVLPLNPNFQVRLFAWYVVGGKQLSTRKMNFCVGETKVHPKIYWNNHE